MAFRFIGVSSTAITDGGSQAPTINGQTWSTSNLLNGDTCMYNYGRFMWNTSTGKWVGQGDVNIHSDVQSALNDIIVANKGEEVRGSIYDALALVDARTDMLDQDIRKDANNIVHSEFGFSIQFDLKGVGETSKSSKTIAQINEALALNKCIIANVKYGGEWRYSMTCVVQAYSAATYEMTVYAPTDDGENIEIFEIRSSGFSNVTYTRTVVPISGGGGGGSYTDGNGIDITNHEISVKLRSTNPGLAFDSNGNLYATGGGGGSYTAGDGIDITNNVISADAVECNVSYNVANNVLTIPMTRIEFADLLKNHTVCFTVSITNQDGSIVYSKITNAQYYFTYHGAADFSLKLCIYDMTETNTVQVISATNVILSIPDGELQTMSAIMSTLEIQKKLTAGTGISIDPTTNTISLDLPQAEGGGF